MEGLGFNWKILLGQLINFAILFFLLRKFVFGRVLNLLKTRREKIEEGLKKSDEAAQNLVKIRGLETEIRDAGEQAARDLLKASEINAQKKAQEVLTSAEKEKEAILVQAEERAQRELKEGLEMQRKETIEASLLVAEKFLGEKFDKDRDKKLLEDLVRNLK
jgi:F-type H+-transporting ATPase subunit b